MPMTKFDPEGIPAGKCPAHEEMFKQLITNTAQLSHGAEQFKSINTMLANHGKCLDKIENSMSRVEGYMNGKAQVRKSVIAWVGIVVTVAIVMVGATVTISKSLGKMEHVIALQNEVIRVLQIERGPSDER